MKPQYRYKCVAVPTVMQTGTKGKKANEQAVTNYNTLINNAAEGGWELVLIDTVQSYQPPGCLMALLGGKATVTTFKLLVFKSIT